MANKKITNNIRCSFCGKPQEMVKKIIAGPNVFICDECINVCNNIMDNEVYEDEKGYTDVKSENSYRVVPMLNKVVRILKEYKEQKMKEYEEVAELGEGFREEDFIFKTKCDNPINSEYLRKTCQAICESHNFRNPELKKEA